MVQADTGCGCVDGGGIGGAIAGTEHPGGSNKPTHSTKLQLVRRPFILAMPMLVLVWFLFTTLPSDCLK